MQLAGEALSFYRSQCIIDYSLTEQDRNYASVCKWPADCYAKTADPDVMVRTEPNAIPH